MEKPKLCFSTNHLVWNRSVPFAFDTGTAKYKKNVLVAFESVLNDLPPKIVNDLAGRISGIYLTDRYIYEEGGDRARIAGIGNRSNLGVIVMISAKFLRLGCISKMTLRAVIAHELAHVFLDGRNHTELEADELAIRWGFREEYEFYLREAKMFNKKYGANPEVKVGYMRKLNEILHQGKKFKAGERR